MVADRYCNSQEADAAILSGLTLGVQATEAKTLKVQVTQRRRASAVLLAAR